MSPIEYLVLFILCFTTIKERLIFYHFHFYFLHVFLFQNSEQNYCKTGVILGTDTSFEFLQFLEFIKRSLQKIEVPQVAEDVAKAIFHRREEEEKRNRLICPRLLRFGECWPSPLSCPERHVLIKDIDHPQLMPM